MPLVGQEKKDWEFVSYRAKQQTEYWPSVVEQLDEVANGQRHKSEVRSYSGLWALYTGTVKEEVDEEAEARGSKKDKVKQIEPIKIRRYINKNGDDIKARFSDDGYLDFPNWLRARDQARKDLFWLGKNVFGQDFEPHVHQVVCDQFVQKDFDGVYKKNYSVKDFQYALTRQNRVPRIWINTGDYKPNTLEDLGKYIPDPVSSENPDNFARTMILLDPRGFFKSTIDGIDAVQWIINCPDVRILLLGGVIKLALQFLAGIKSKFFLPRGQRARAFHLLFPEYVIRGVDGDSAQPMTTPARVHESIDPTLGIISIGSSLSGFHCDVAKLDDVVTDENSNKPETREAIKEKADGTRDLLMPWGWADIIGTRYFVDDYYGTTLVKHEEDPIQFPLKYFRRAAWTVKPEFVHLRLLELKEHMVVLTFPEMAGFTHLFQKLKGNQMKFRCQQLNEPAGDELGVRVQFEEGAIKAHVIRPDEAQRKTGDTFTACDRGFSDKRYSDFSVIATGRVFEREDRTKALVVLEVVFERWRDPQLAAKIAEVNAKWNPKIFFVEDGPRTDLLKREVLDNFRTRVGRFPTNMHWQMPDSQPDAKRNRIRGLATLLKNDQLYFADGPWIDDLIYQFTKYTGERSSTSRKDDIPDAISLLSRFLPVAAIVLTPTEVEAKKEFEEKEYQKWLLNEHYKRVFGSDHINKPPVALDMPRESGPIDSIVNRLGLGGLFRK